MDFVQFLTQWNAEIIASANILIAFGTIVLAIGIPASIRSARREERDTFYATLDRTYFDIQKMIVDHPHLANPDPTGKSRDQIVQYEAFAFMTWNFIESIFDYAKDDEVLTETWHCILDYESDLHSSWFSDPRNHGKFKPRFRDYIRERMQARQVPADSATAEDDVG